MIIKPQNLKITAKKSPRPRAGAVAQTGCTLTTDLKAVSWTRAAAGAAAKDVTRGDDLDPKRTVALVVRGGTGVAQRVEAVHRRSRVGGGEARQLEHHPRAGIELLHVDVQRRPFGGHLVLGASSYVGFPFVGQLLAIAAENDGRPRRRAGTSDSTAAWGNGEDNRLSRRSRGAFSRTGRAGRGSRGACGTGTRGTAGRTTGTGRAAGTWRTTAATAATAEAAEPNSTTAAAHVHAANITLTNKCVPGGLG